MFGHVSVGLNLVNFKESKIFIRIHTNTRKDGKMRTIKANQISFGLYSVYVFEESKLIEHHITPKKPKNLEEE